MSEWYEVPRSRDKLNIQVINVLPPLFLGPLATATTQLQDLVTSIEAYLHTLTAVSNTALQDVLRVGNQVAQIETKANSAQETSAKTLQVILHNCYV